MNEDELELQRRESRLRNELQRAVVPPDAPDSLYRHVAELGLTEPVGRSAGLSFAAMPRGRGVRRGAGILGGLATAACIAALLAVGLFWRSSHTTSGISGGSPGPAASAIATPVVSPTALPTPSHFPAWSGTPAYVEFSGRLDAEFGYVAGMPEPYPGGNATHLYLTYDGGATWVDRAPAGITGFLNLHFADRLNAWFMEDVMIGSAPGTGDTLSSHWVWRTGDGGITWSKYAVPVSSIYMATNLDMKDGVHGLMTFMSWDQTEPTYGSAPGTTPVTGRRAGMAMVGPARTVLNQLWRTDDGGATWTKLMDVRADPAFPAWATLSTADEGWGSASNAAGAPLLTHSIDGGRTWKSAALPLPKGYVQTTWTQPAPSGSGGDLTLAGIVSNSSIGVDVPTWAYVTWTSADDGGSWSLASTTPLGLAWTIDTAAFSDRFLLIRGPATGTALASLRYLDLDSPGSPGQLDASSVCGGTLSWATMTSPQDAWAQCQVDGATPRGWHQYLYKTTDGGKTWTKMLGAP
jgi:hypothetical protein